MPDGLSHTKKSSTKSISATLYKGREETNHAPYNASMIKTIIADEQKNLEYIETRRTIRAEVRRNSHPLPNGFCPS